MTQLKIKELFNWPENCPNIPIEQHNWGFNEIHEIMLKYNIDYVKPKIILEIGSWMGAGSTSFLLKNAPDAHLICLDHWSENLRDFVSVCYPMDYVIRDYHLIKNLWEKFLQNTWEYQDRMTPLRTRSKEGLEILKNLNIEIDLIYLDSEHGYDAVSYEISKCLEYWPKATLCGDDYEWENHDVKRAVHDYADTHNKKVFVLDRRCWFYRDKKNITII